MKTLKRTFLVFWLTTIVGVFGISGAYAEWGCGAQSRDGAWGDSWAHTSKSEAQQTALQECESSRELGEAPCHIVGCSANIDTADEADARWELE